DARIAWYPEDNLKLNIGYRHDNAFLRTREIVGGIDYNIQFGNGTAAQLYGEASYDFEQDRGVSFMLGLRFAFGSGNKSLIRREREDYLPIYLGRDAAALPKGISKLPTAEPGAPGEP